MVQITEQPDEQTKVVTSDEILSTSDVTEDEVSSWFDTVTVNLDVKRVAIISDIHSNHVAFEAVLEDMKNRQYDAVISLGDFVGYYTHPNEVVEKVKEISNVNVIGNHDFAVIEPEEMLYSTLQAAARKALDYNKEVISESNSAWLAKLPMKIKLITPYATATLVHGDPVTIFGYIYGNTEELFEASIKKALDFVDTDYLMVGHSHIQGHYSNGSGKTYINPGSVGQPRDRDPTAAYGIVDFEKGTHELIRVPYAIDVVQQHVVDCCLPDYLATRLERGE